MFEPTSLAKLAWFECIHVVLVFIEKNILNVLVVLSAVTVSSEKLILKFIIVEPSGYLACLIISMMSLKMLRHSFCEPAKQYQIFLIAYLFHKFDSSGYSFFIESETILLGMYFLK